MEILLLLLEVERTVIYFPKNSTWENAESMCACCGRRGSRLFWCEYLCFAVEVAIMSAKAVGWLRLDCNGDDAIML